VFKEIVQSEKLTAALDTEKGRSEKLQQRAVVAEKQLKMAVRKNRVLAMENHLAIQRLHSLGVSTDSKETGHQTAQSYGDLDVRI
jgi:hypothetical protein